MRVLAALARFALVPADRPSHVPTCRSWLLDLLNALNNGRIDAFNTIITQNAAAFAAQPALAEGATELKRKVALLALVDAVFQRGTNERTIKFAEIASRTQLPLDQVEWLVMRAMSLKLVKGTIDQVAQCVHFRYVQPRVLDKGQLVAMQRRLGEWSSSVHGAKTLLEQQNVASLYE